MKIHSCVCLLLLFLSCSSAYAESRCVGMAKNKYCLGVPPNKESYFEFSIDKGIDIQSRKDRSSYYNYGQEVEVVSGLSLTTTLTIKDGKVSRVQQNYEINAENPESKNKVYALLYKRLFRQYGKPTATSKLDKVNYSEWVSKYLDIYITDIYEDHVSVYFSIPSTR